MKYYFNDPTDEYKLNPSYEFTNDPTIEHGEIKSYANDENVQKFKELKIFESVGLIEPLDAEYMHFATMKNKSCKLTALGAHYWKLSNDNRLYGRKRAL